MMPAVLVRWYFGFWASSVCLPLFIFRIPQTAAVSFCPGFIRAVHRRVWVEDPLTILPTTGPSVHCLSALKSLRSVCFLILVFDLFYLYGKPAGSCLGPMSRCSPVMVLILFSPIVLGTWWTLWFWNLMYICSEKASWIVLLLVASFLFLFPLFHRLPLFKHHAYWTYPLLFFSLMF